MYILIWKNLFYIGVQGRALKFYPMMSSGQGPQLNESYSGTANKIKV